jgi:hypothetical protein
LRERERERERASPAAVIRCAGKRGDLKSDVDVAAVNGVSCRELPQRSRLRSKIGHDRAQDIHFSESDGRRFKWELNWTATICSPTDASRSPVGTADWTSMNSNPTLDWTRMDSNTYSGIQLGRGHEPSAKDTAVRQWSEAFCGRRLTPTVSQPRSAPYAFGRFAYDESRLG